MSVWLQCILSLIFLRVASSVGGYFVNILQFKELCPLTSFCAPWNPTKGSKSLQLIQHAKINFSLGDVHILAARGRLKSDDPSCWSSAGSGSNLTTNFCQLFADTGYVVCEQDPVGTYFDNSANRYMVPKKCVEWLESPNHMTRAFYREIRFEIPSRAGHLGESS